MRQIDHMTPREIDTLKLKGMLSGRASEPEPELFTPADQPFNLAGELIDNGITAEGAARLQALAAHEARKAQLLIFALDKRIKSTGNHGGFSFDE